MRDFDRRDQNKTGYRPINNIAQKKKSSGGPSTIEDNRPETARMQAMQEMMANSTNPRLMQLKEMQDMINGSERVQQMTARQEVLQKKGPEDEEELQLKADKPVQRKGPDDEDMQLKAEEPVQKQGNRTGLPDDLKAGVENLSGLAMDDVRVRYNSGKPAQLNAHAYTQGTEIHVAPGQEKHLPHEAWHVVQQKEGRVRPTVQLKGGVAVNDDTGLEKEADVMGGKAVQGAVNRPEIVRASSRTQNRGQSSMQSRGSLIQTMMRRFIPSGKLQKFNPLAQAVKNDDKNKFSSLFRNMDQGKDEFISCNQTFKQARQYLNRNDPKGMYDWFNVSHETRLDTGMVAHNVGVFEKGKWVKKEGYHPTSQNDNSLQGPVNNKGNRRWVNHTRFDRARADHVEKKKSTTEKRDAAIEYTLNNFAQPPFARNSNVRLKNTQKNQLWNKKREYLKRKHSAYKKGKYQKADAPWYPGKRKRGVSPGRR
ncbi:MAG: DUF4157 domain-containing protein [Candidatus Electrothrix scaldis]|nr:MAG: DUF4157 domain-containing protein [Candidatus Electrothrix sp. GW3-3]